MALEAKDIISGPIVRRVEPTEVSIWITLKKTAKIELSVWNGMITYNTEGNIIEDPIHKVEQNTVQIGKFLHMTVVHLPLPEEKLLKWGQIYSYNLKFTTEDNASADFKSLGLLDKIDDPENLGYTTISYLADQLPSFVLPAEKVEDLKVLHGSCRNNDNMYDDALSYADNLIKENLEDPLKRPQQFFLSGDQIYADYCVGTQLNELTEIGSDLLDNKETLPTTWANPELNSKNRWPADTKHFPAFIRKELMDSEARFTSGGSSNHLIAFGEFAGMYLHAWSDITWPEDIDNNMQNFEGVFNVITAVPQNYGAIFRRNLFDERTGEVEIFRDDVMKKTLEILFQIEDKTILKALLSGKGTEDQKNQAANIIKNFLNTLNTQGDDGNESEKKQSERFIDYLKELVGTQYQNDDEYTKRKNKLKVLKQTLPKVRRALANISTFMIFDDHEVTDDWNLNPSWRDRVFTSSLGKSIIRNGMMAYALFQDWGNRASRYNREGHFFELDTKLVDDLKTEQFTDDLKTAFEEKGVTINKDTTTVKILFDKEWIVKNAENKDEFIVREYEKVPGESEKVLKVLGNSHAHLLKKIPELFAESVDNIIAKEDHIDFLFGLDVQHRVKGPAGGRQQIPDGKSPLIKWHYSYIGPKHKVLAIDNRTRRSYVNFDGAPGNLSFNGMKDLIPDSPEVKDDEVLFVIAPLPVLGPSLLDEVIAPLSYKVFDLKDYYAKGNAVKSGMKGTNPDAIEAWAFDPVSTEELLKRLAPYKKVIFLSGDVHYAASQRLCYWKKDQDKAAACFAQLTASGFRNVMPSYILGASQHFLTAQKLIRQNVKAERLGWFDHKIEPKPLVLPNGSKKNFMLDKLKESPVVIPVIGWPKGTTTGRKPDWAWRLENVIDYREEKDRPSSTRMEVLEETDDVMKNLQNIARRHIAQAKKANYTRQILFKPNIGMVTFHKSTNGPLHVHHSIYSAFNEGKPEAIQDHKVYTLHKIALEASEEEKAPEINS